MNNEKDVGRKDDKSKIRYDLVPVTALEGLAKVFTFGASKYSENNWKKVTPSSRYYAAALRHIMADQQGELNDPESGLLHLDHAITSLVMYRELKIEELKVKEKK